jgi:2-methylcitrate dehydratase PrpD
VADRGFRWEHIADASKMADPVIQRLLDKVVFDPNPPPLPDRFPHRHGGRVTIVMRDGRQSSSVCAAPRGSGPRGVEWTDVDDKYRRLVANAGLDSGAVTESLERLHAFDTISDVSTLTDLLEA